MDDAIYVAVNRQRGLALELLSIANNVANLSTRGYRREGMVFSEFVTRTGSSESLSMANLGAYFYDSSFGVIETTGGTFDLAIEGPGYFVVETPDGERLTRAGAFVVNPEGELTTADGHRVLDDGGAPIAIPAEVAAIEIGPDGTLSADGAIVARIGVATAEPGSLSREGSVLYVPDAGFEALEFPRVRQGALEASNVNPIIEMARLIEVQRAYERSNTLIEGEDERIGRAIRTLGRES